LVSIIVITSGPQRTLSFSLGRADLDLIEYFTLKLLTSTSPPPKPVSNDKMAGVTGIALSSSFLTYPLLFFLISKAVVFILNSVRPKAFPPGPRGLPVLGNLLQVDKTFPFLTYGAWAKDYGSDTPLGLKKGAINMVVLNSGRLVRELFERRGAVYSDRPPQFMNNTWVFTNGLKAGFIAQNSSTWLTRLRRELNNNFGPAAITRLRPVYEAETARLLVKLLESPRARRGDLEDILVCWMMSVPCLAVCGRRPDSMTDHGFEIEQFRRCSDEYAALVAPKAWDLFPVLRHLPGFGIPEWKERARGVREAVLKTGSQFLSTAKEQRTALDAGKPIAWESMLAKILREQREKNEQIFTEADMGTPAFHIVSAAVNTSLAVFSIALMILAKYPELQQRARNEVLKVSGGAIPKATDLPSLKYTDAFWNEV
jgi:cytochrome P450